MTVTDGKLSTGFKYGSSIWFSVIQYVVKKDRIAAEVEVCAANVNKVSAERRAHGLE